MSHVARTRKVALSRVTLRERRAGRASIIGELFVVAVVVVVGWRDSEVMLGWSNLGVVAGGRRTAVCCVGGGYIDWRCVEQNVSSRNSRFAAIPALASTGLILKQNETLSSPSPSRVE